MRLEELSKKLACCEIIESNRTFFFFVSDSDMDSPPNLKIFC